MRHTPALVSASTLIDLVSAGSRRGGDDEPIESVVGGVIRPSEKVMWLVQWPEHVINPRFNSDAYYSRAGRASTARGREMIARRYGAELV